MDNKYIELKKCKHPLAVYIKKINIKKINEIELKKEYFIKKKFLLTIE